MTEFVSGNVFIREGLLQEPGDVVVTHAHNFDHTTYVARGAARVEHVEPLGADGKPWADRGDGVAPSDFRMIASIEKRAGMGRNWVLIKAGAWHRITALEPSTLYHCIYSHRTPQGEIVQEYDGWQKALT